MPMMQKIALLGLAVVISMVSGTVPTVEAEPIPSPYRQMQDGVPIGEIVCAGSRILMQSQSGMPVCVFVDSIRPLEMRGFVLLGEITSESFPIGGSADCDPCKGPLPEIGISRLPNIGETAIIEVRYTNDSLFGVADSKSFQYRDNYITGWRISQGFEVVNSYGLAYETEYWPGTNQTRSYTYTAFTPLNAGESKTYHVEIRAVEDVYGFVAGRGIARNIVEGIGYYHEEAYIQMRLDNEETMLLVDHMELYPELYVRPARATSNEEPQPKPEPLTEEECLALAASQTESAREQLIAVLIEYVRDEQLAVGRALENLLLPYGPLNMADVRQVLTGAGYTDGEINDAVSGHVPTQSHSERDGAPWTRGCLR